MKTLVLGAVTAALLHITPTVVLVKRQDAVAHLLPGADQFAAREVHVSSADSRRIHTSRTASRPVATGVCRGSLLRAGSA